jgi:site-specific DNA-methyltransferase (adenine-specific)/modification methylase
MDCIEGMKKIDSNNIDAIITDVPYNLGEGNPNLIKFKNREDMNKANIDKWNKDFNPIEWLPEAKRILKNDGNIFVFTSHRNFGDYFNWMDKNFERTFFGAWHKTNPVPQVRKVSFLSSLELFICSWNVPHKWNFSSQNDMHNLIEYPICMGDERTEHSAQKPLDVMAYIIKVTTNENDVVLDPFMGSGTTAIASRLLNRNFIGFEIDNNYYNISLKRIMNIPCRLEEFKT